MKSTTKIRYEGKTYIIKHKKVDSNWICSVSVEKTIFHYSVDKESDIARVGLSGIKANIAFNKIWGVKKMKAKQYNFVIFGYKFTVTFMTPYISKAWLWRFKRYTCIKGFILRIFGIEFNIREDGGMDRYLAERNKNQDV